MTQAIEKIGVFLLAFGAPRSLKPPDLSDFLAKVTHREPSEEMVENLSRRYKCIGGRSPLVNITNSQARALENELAPTPANGGVFIGLRFGEPSVSDAAKEATEKGIEKAVAITHAPQYSQMVIEAYRKSLTDALRENGAEIKVDFVESYGHDPLFIESISAKIKEIFPSEPSKITEIPIIFTAHSLPADSAGANKYVGEVKNTAAQIAQTIGNSSFEVAFQSPGASGGKWLGPSVGEVIERFSNSGINEIIIVPVGFVAENLETLYDLDLQAAELARKSGINAYRAPALDDSPYLISCWKDAILKKLEECD